LCNHERIMMAMTTSLDTITGWFRGRIPPSWFIAPVALTVDRDEILLVGELAEPDTADLGEDGRLVARAERIAAFREATREQRIAIARDGEHRFERKVSWGARCGDREELFTVASVPAMTRLRLPERQVLDTLIDAGIARSRSEAMAWCVRLVGKHQGDWITQLRAAMAQVEQVRANGPS
jgi:hypothetical protein